MKWVKIALLGLTACAVLLAAGLATLLSYLATEAGTVRLVGLLESVAQPYLSVGRVRGVLWDRVTLDDVEIALPTDAVQIRTMTLSWDPRALLGGTLALDEASLGPVSYRRLAVQPSDRAPMQALPLRIEIRRGEVEALTVAAGNESLQFEGATFSAALEGERLSIERIETVSGGVELAGRAAVRLQPVPSLTVEVDWATQLEGRALQGRARVEGELPQLALYHELTAPFRAVARGSLLLEPRPSVDLDIEWTDLVVAPWEALTSPSGRLRLAGAVDDFRFEAAGALGIEGQAARFELQGTGEGPLLSLETLVLESGDASFSGSGEFSLDSLEWLLQVEGRELDPGVLLEDWPGRVQVTGRVQGRLRPELEWRLTGATLAGELRGLPVRATGGLQYRSSGAWTLDSIELESGLNRLQASGTIRDRLDLSLRARAPDLSALWPGLAGVLQADLRFGGTLQEPAVSGELQARALEFRDYAVANLRLVSDIGSAADPALALGLEAEQLVSGGFRAARVQARVAGTARRHELVLDTASEQWSGRLEARGGLDEGSWRGSIETLTLEQAVLGEWTLSAPAALEAGRDALALASTCLGQAQARVCGSARWSAAAGEALELAAEALDIEALTPFFPPGFSARGLYQGSLALTRLSGGASATLSVEGGATRVVLQPAGQSPFETQLDAVRLTAVLSDEGRLELDASLSGRETGTVGLHAQLEDVGAEDPAVSAQLGLHWPDLSFVSLLSPDIGEVAGTMDVDVMIDGSVNAPRVQGRGQWSGGELAVPAWGLVIEGIEASARSPDGTTLEFLARGVVGEGLLDLQGMTELNRQAGWPTRLTLRGDSIQAVQLPEAEIFVSPDLDVRVELPDIYATGAVHIPSARLELEQLPAAAVAPSPDAVLHGVEQPPVSRPLKLHADLRFTLGDDVRYSGSGLDASLAGQLRLMYESGRAANASGTLNLSGHYDAYSQELELDRGQLIFTGPWNDPTLDVRAVRRVEETTVGVQLTGRLTNPQTRIFSEPALSEADALSYLLLGRPLTGTGQEETATLQSAAIAMGLQQALPVVERIGQSLGLDELSVQTTDTDAGALMAGKYLSPKVYIRYSYGLFNRMGGLLLRFRLNERLSVETRSGDQKSMDILYTVEKD